MLNSFFFIPPTIHDFANKLQKIVANYMVVDFEESINDEQFDKIATLVSCIISKESVFVRPALRNENGKFSTKQYNSLLQLGFKKFVLPKIETKNELLLLIAETGEAIKDCNFVLSIESPTALLNINELINNQQLNFWGLIFGSHDFCSYSGMAHTLENLYAARFLISTYASAHNLFSIDIASVNTNDAASFNNELLASANLGYNAKAILHPDQLLWLNNFNHDFHSKKMNEAIEIIDYFNKNGKPLIFKYKGMIYEKPHMKRLLKFIDEKKK